MPADRILQKMYQEVRASSSVHVLDSCGKRRLLPLESASFPPRFTNLVMSKEPAMRRLLVVLGCVSLAAVASLVEAADAKSIVLFNGKDMSGWKIKGTEAKSKWSVGQVAVDDKSPSKLAVTPLGDGGSGILINASGGVNLYTEQKFGDGTIEVEFMIPKGSNSGIYVIGEYEVQILDSFGKEKVGPGDMGGLYGAAAPKVNACKKPGDWQKFVIEYQAPRFEDNKKVANAKFIKI